jgi:uncharacterized protein (DUF924 family)
MEAQDIIDFWFSGRVRKKWWSKDAAFDEECCGRFMEVHQKVCAGELSHWRETPAGRLAEILVLDQLSRNMFRDQAAAFAQDAMARELTRVAVGCGDDQLLSPEQRAFLYMPLMHSESPEDHEEAMRLFASHPDLANNLEFERKHKVIIDRFGRYPHRNAVLGRASTEEETAFLEKPGSSF